MSASTGRGYTKVYLLTLAMFQLHLCVLAALADLFIRQGKLK